MSTLIGLPEAVSCRIFVNWLQLADLSKLDSSFCNHQQRVPFKDTAYGSSPRLVYENIPAIKSMKDVQYRQFLTWLSLRGLHVKKFCIVLKHQNMLHEHLGDRGASLRSIDLVGYEIHAALRQMIMADIVAYSPALTHLGMDCFFFDTTDTITSLFRHCNDIISLRIACSSERCSAFAVVAEHCTHLRNFEISSIGIGTEDLQCILQRNAATLESLHMLRCYHLMDCDYRTISQCTHLKVLRLATANMAADTVSAIVHACPSLVELDMGYHAMTDTLVIDITTACPLLQVLHLDYCQDITEVALLAIADNCTALTHLSLAGNPCASDENIDMLFSRRRNLLIRTVPRESFLSFEECKRMY